MEQYILRNSTGELPVMDEYGEWINAEEVIHYGSLSNPAICWLFPRIMRGRNSDELEGKVFPITNGELYGILLDSKECVHEKDELLVMELFDTGLFYSNHDFDWCMEAMADFNRVMAGKLRNSKKIFYFYYYG